MFVLLSVLAFTRIALYETMSTSVMLQRTGSLINRANNVKLNFSLPLPGHQHNAMKTF